MSAPLESLLQLRLQLQPGEFSDSGASRIEALRRDGLASFKEQGLPTNRVENWKGTRLAPLAAMEFTRVGRSQHTSSRMLESVEALAREPELVFIDGEFDARLSRLTDLPNGVRVSSLSDSIQNDPGSLDGILATLTDLKIQPLVALQTAFLSDGAFVSVDPSAQIDRPIRLLFISTDDNPAAASSDDAASMSSSAAFPRLLVVAGKNSSLTLQLEHVSAGSASGFTNFVAEFLLAEGANVETLEIQAEADARIHFTSAHARLDRNAVFNSHVVTVGRGLVRSELEIKLAEPGAEAALCGLFMGLGHAHLDHFTTVDHAAERCTSDQEYRGVLADRSKGVFRGRVLVRPGAQKTDATQSNPNILLSDHATIDTKPQLEIYADDIRASHGSTIGQLDADALFFMQARGIDLEEAKSLLTGAFARGVIARIKDPALRESAMAFVEMSLAEISGHAVANSSSDSLAGQAIQ
ncbi:MAG: Fe-S cluster assembly protein SufD [Myxococcales bacterium]|nr:Fe-S cluster assembly protein SufD [Myxococcales bacterium]HIK83529.1 Fe-S cluster assembly protein SufD [Myxococcales bacterium]